MTAKDLIRSDRARRSDVPLFQVLLRRASGNYPPPIRLIYKVLCGLLKRFHCIEISSTCKIGKGLYIGHPYCITINPNATIGDNCNIHKGVTIGQENRGPRQGSPAIGSRVWIGVNATVVGRIFIGDDVMIAPNTFVNCDIPSHSVVFGNPCQIKHRDNATEGYINNIV